MYRNLSDRQSGNMYGQAFFFPLPVIIITQRPFAHPDLTFGKLRETRRQARSAFVDRPSSSPVEKARVTRPRARRCQWAALCARSPSPKNASWSASRHAISSWMMIASLCPTRKPALPPWMTINWSRIGCTLSKVEGLLVGRACRYLKTHISYLYLDVDVHTISTRLSTRIFFFPWA